MEKSPFQFALKGMFAAITTAAMLLAGLLATDPGVQLVTIMAILWLFWAAIMVACAYAFSVAAHQGISCSIGFGTDSLLAQGIGRRMAELFHSLLASWTFAPVSGLCCVATHWLFVRPPISNG